MPDALLVVSGSLPPNEVADYLAAGAYAACLGDALWRWSDVARGDVDAVQACAAQVLADIDRDCEAAALAL